MRAATLRIAPATVKAGGPPSGGGFGQGTRARPVLGVGRLALDLTLANEPQGECGAGEAEQRAEREHVVEAREESLASRVRDALPCSRGHRGERLVQVARRRGLDERAWALAAAGFVVAPRGRPVAVAGFTVAHGKVVEIDLLADPERLRRLDLTVLDG
jgi:hypothetical protein